MSRGWRVDLHVKVIDDAVVKRAKARGLEVLVYAPHFRRLPEIRETAARYTDDDLLVVPAREVFTGSWRDRKHVLAIGLDEPVPDFITLSGAMDELVRQDAAVLVPHPEFMTVSLTESDVDRYRDAVHAIEVYNPKHLPSHNRRARELAARFDLPAFGSSYAHLRRTVGEVWTTVDDVERSTDGLVAALKSGDMVGVERRNGGRHRLRCAAEFGHLFYENTWGKVDRLLLSGMEATHPRHPAYEGRFDDVAVY